MSLKSPKSWAALVVTGEKLDLKEISSILNIEPDFSQDSNSLDLDGNPFIPIWQLNSKLNPDESLENHLWELLKVIGPARLTFKKIVDEFKVSLYCSVEFSSEAIDGYSLSPKVLMLIGSLGMHIDFNPWQNIHLEEEDEEDLEDSKNIASNSVV